MNLAQLEKIDGAVPNRGQSWRFRFCGRFEIFDGREAAQQANNRKVQALFAILAYYAPRGISRQELGAILWPELGPEARSNNLRQTLSRAKSITGLQSIDGSRVHCGFADGFLWSSDIDRADSTFMPGFQGDWFDKVRSARTRVSVAPITESFANILEWMSQTDPERALGMLRENLELAIGLPVSDMRRILGRLNGVRSLPGWFAYFRATIREDGYSSAEADFRRVLTQAERIGDFLLGVQTAAQLVICLVRQGKMPEAREMGALCETIAVRSGNAALRPTATQIQAMVLLHGGQLNAGLELLERAESEYRLTMDAVLMRTLRGLYLALYGRHSEADECLEWPRKYLEETGHGLIQVTSAIAQIKARAQDVDPRLAIEEHERVLRITESFFNEWHAAVANEELAMAYLRVGEVPLAQQKVAAAKKVRRTMAMGYTPLDTFRLRSAGRR
jgi:hypothetical protein